MIAKAHETVRGVLDAYDFSRFRRIVDAYIFMDIIHDWDDKHALQNLTAVATAGW